jgi:heavy metal translocating P-type ATPase
MVRLADRYAWWFLLLTLAIAAAARLVSHDHIRVLAVLVVATPCPLILAVPVAMISGMSRAARSGILFKTGGALENMARIRTVILDKTGTLTFGDARVHAIHPVAGVDEDEVLRFAASLDQASSHPIARALVAEARARGLPLSLPSALNEQAGSGIEGEVEGRRVALGGTDYVAARAETAGSGALGTSGAVTVSMALDGQWAGEIVLADEVRPDAARVVSALRELGVGRVILASGDRPQVAEAVGSALGVDRVLGGLTPADKADLVAAEGKAGHVMMIGDGTNDAPALARADVGVAMGSRGGAAAAEAAAAVVLVDRLEPVIAGMRIARRARRIALESVYFGLGLSILGMLAAAAGFVPPVGGALLQEAIDIVVILNALRVLR